MHLEACGNRFVHLGQELFELGGAVAAVKRPDDLAGGGEAAERVEPTLPETGVSGGAGLFDGPEAAEQSGGGCCAVPATLTIGSAPVPSGGC